MHGPLSSLTDEGLQFLRERHLATLTTLLPDGRPHVVAVGFTVDLDANLARVITDAASRKARNLPGPAALCQVDGARWLTVEGDAVAVGDPLRVAEAERRYAERYRVPRVNPTRVVLEIAVARVLGSTSLFLTN